MSMSNGFYEGQNVFYINTETKEKVRCRLYKIKQGFLYIEEIKSGKKRKINMSYWNRQLFPSAQKTYYKSKDTYKKGKAEQKKKRSKSRKNSAYSKGVEKESRYTNQHYNELYNRMVDNGWKYNARKLSEDGDGVMDMPLYKNDRKNNE